MHQTKNRLNIDAGYWTVCRDCCEWTDDAVEDCWNPQPGVGWVCPKCAARPAAVYGGFPLLEVPKPKECTCQVIHDGVTFFNCRAVDPNCPIHATKLPEQRATLFQKLWAGLVTMWWMR